MKSSRTILFLMFAMLVFTSQAIGQKKVKMDDLRAEVQAMEDAFAKAYNAKDAKTVAVYYADDAVSYGPEQPPLVGKSAIIADMEKNFAEEKHAYTMRYEVVDLWASGNLVVETGKSFRKDDMGEQESGKYISVFERRDGKLVCVRDSYNSNFPEDEDDD